MSNSLKMYSHAEYHYVFGEVYAPEQVDSDGEAMKAEDIQKMAHDFIARGLVKSLDTNHNKVLNGAEVVESFIARKGDADFTEGAWVLGVRMTDGELWDAIKSGEINSFSFEATVNKVVSDKDLPMYTVAAGKTEKSQADDIIEPHTHAYYLEFDSNGQVKKGQTDEVLGHFHKICGSVVTEKTNGHYHRFFLENLK